VRDRFIHDQNRLLVKEALADPGAFDPGRCCTRFDVQIPLERASDTPCGGRADDASPAGCQASTIGALVVLLPEPGAPSMTTMAFGPVARCSSLRGVPKQATNPGT
jgi:hypothetical protein